MTHHPSRIDADPGMDWAAEQPDNHVEVVLPRYAGWVVIAVITIIAFVLGVGVGRTSAHDGPGAALEGPQLLGVTVGEIAARGPSGVTTGPVTPVSGAVVSGTATWYDDGAGYYAAVPSWHWGDRRYFVTVCHGSRCVTVTVRDFCACGGNRVIDLSPSAFRRLAPLSRGVVSVTVLRGGGPIPTPPATDSSP